MPIRYPVNVARDTSRLLDAPWGIFDRVGYWACVAPSGMLRFPPDQYELAATVAGAINQAHADGNAEARWAMREALGIEEDD